MKRWMAVAAVCSCLSGVSMAAPLHIDIDAYNFTPLPATITQETGTLVLSDSPEYVGPEAGIVALGTINGDGRVYFYHVNESQEPRKMAIVVENTGTKTGTVTVTRAFTTTPSPKYFEVGRSLSRKELEIQPSQESTERLTLVPGSREVVFAQLEQQVVQPDDLTTGIVDVTTTQPMLVRVMMMPMWMSPWAASRTLPVLPIDGVELRGTYTGRDRTLQTPVYDSSVGPAAVEIANNREDRFLRGIDEGSHGLEVLNAGNYGTSNVLTIPTQGDRPFAVYVNPMGGAYAGSFQMQQGNRVKIYDVPGAEEPHLGHETIYHTQYLDTFTPGEDLVITYMPAGASNLPVRFLLVPEEDQPDPVRTFQQQVQKKQGASTQTGKKGKSKIS